MNMAIVPSKKRNSMFSYFTQNRGEESFSDFASWNLSCLRLQPLFFGKRGHALPQLKSKRGGGRLDTKADRIAMERYFGTWVWPKLPVACHVFGQPPTKHGDSTCSVEQFWRLTSGRAQQVHLTWWKHSRSSQCHFRKRVGTVQRWNPVTKSQPAISKAQDWVPPILTSEIGTRL